MSAGPAWDAVVMMGAWALVALLWTCAVWAALGVFRWFWTWWWDGALRTRRLELDVEREWSDRTRPEDQG